MSFFQEQLQKYTQLYENNVQYNGPIGDRLFLQGQITKLTNKLCTLDAFEKRADNNDSVKLAERKAGDVIPIGMKDDIDIMLDTVVPDDKFNELSKTIGALLDGAGEPIPEPPGDEDNDDFIDLQGEESLNRLRESRRERSAREQTTWQAKISQREQQHVAEGMSIEEARKLTQYELYPASIPRGAEELELCKKRRAELIRAGKTKDEADLIVGRESYNRSTEQGTFDDIVRKAQKSDASKILDQSEININH